MMKFFNIGNTAAFLEKILDCSGNIYCRDSSGCLRDLKQTARQLTDCSWLFRPERLDEIDVVAEHPADFQKLYRYMMESACAK